MKKKKKEKAHTSKHWSHRSRLPSSSKSKKQCSVLKILTCLSSVETSGRLSSPSAFFSSVRTSSSASEGPSGLLTAFFFGREGTWATALTGLMWTRMGSNEWRDLAMGKVNWAWREERHGDGVESIENWDWILGIWELGIDSRGLRRFWRDSWLCVGEAAVMRD